MKDFAQFAQRWLNENCGLCGNADLDCDKDVGLFDLVIFAGNWLAN